ncbi:MAG: 2-amino-4-hydroxy-6-hydroxymethyldihydropteridine diphosphokinase [Candidatus Kapabacteria bacterium]|nr:2-amino-4-hydroxy-6-hydroxymethyldihydropteridine diphosphokinase [Candidatus Kapabacteria bacterium]
MSLVGCKKCSDEIFIALSLGTNIGDREKNIDKAFEYLVTSDILTNAVISSFYETEPVGILNQNWFLNVAIVGYTKCTQFELLQHCKTIEYSIGREKRQRWHEREIDIDIIIYGDTIINEEHLTIPHPRLHKRKFVLIPIAEIAGDVLVPNHNLTFNQLNEECLDSSEVRVYA